MTPEFVLTEEQEALRRTVRQWCERTWTEAAVRRRMPRTAYEHDRAEWQRFGRELGLTAVTLPPELGGPGGGWIELATLAEEIGRALACLPVLGTTMASTALAEAADTTVAQEMLAPVVAGDRIPALVASDALGTWLPAELSIHASQPADGTWRLCGEAHHVLDGVTADDLVVLAEGPTGDHLFLVDGAAAGLRREPISTLDQTRQQGRIVLDDVLARPLGVEDGRAVVERATQVGALVVAAEQLGGSQVMLDRAVEYATVHLQFGRPIGSFQAVRHRCADMAVLVEHARSAVLHAAWAADTSLDDVRLASSLAHVVASEAHVQVAGGALQVHGGVGFTWEHAIHLYLKRAWSDAALLGGRDAHRQHLRPLLSSAA